MRRSTITGEHVPWISTSVLLLDLLIRVGLSLRVIKRRLPVGVALAWLAVILVFPFVGAIVYLLIGEYRLGRYRTRRAVDLAGEVEKRFPRRPGEVVDLGAGGTALARVAEATLGHAPLPGNCLRLLESAEVAFPVLIEDIDKAVRTCDLEFYIWCVGGRADEVVAALIRAAGRGVACRVLVDAIGSAGWLRSRLIGDLRKAGVKVQAALRSGLFQILSARPDLRLHRKIIVIDGEIGYTGSMNLADPLFFKLDAGVGQWVDAFVKVQGPAVQSLALVFTQDWAVEAEQPVDWDRDVPAVSPPSGPATVQVLPTGPGPRVDAIEEVVLAAIYAATEELILTTPYFIPNEAMLAALKSAAGRGVKVMLVVPEKVDSRMVHYASRAHQADLLAAGVHIALFRNGLLHTKSITIDGRYSLFGSLNLDPRSLRLDFEITLAVYDAEFTASLRQLQHVYLEKSKMLDEATCQSRTVLERFAEDAARLASPLL